MIFLRTVSVLKAQDAGIALCILVGILADAFDGFQVSGIPARRLAHILFLFSGLTCCALRWSHFKLRGGCNVPYLRDSERLGVVLASYAFLITAAKSSQQLGELSQFELAFIFARCFHVVLLIYAFWFSSRAICLWKPEKAQRLLELVVTAGLIVALIAIYDYSAARFGYELLVRNSTGTDHGEITTEFLYYGYHRALGTFREPSHLGGYLLPLYFLALHTKRFKSAVVICVGAILSLSLIVYAAAALSILVVAILIVFMDRSAVAWLVNVGLSISASSLLSILLIFQYESASRYSVPAVGYYSAFLLMIFVAMSLTPPKRVRNLVIVQTVAFLILMNTLFLKFSHYGPAPGGYLRHRMDLISQSTERLPGRDYVIDYLASDPVEVFGQGLGHASFNIANFIGAVEPVSFLSSVLFIYKSLGLPGLVLAMGAFFLLIAAIVFQVLHDKSDSSSLGLLSAVIGVGMVWCLLIEEPSVSGILILGLVAGLIRRPKVPQPKKIATVYERSHPKPLP